MQGLGERALRARRPLQAWQPPRSRQLQAGLDSRHASRTPRVRSAVSARSASTDLLLAATSAGTIETLQVLDAGDGSSSFSALWKGQVLKLTAGSDSGMGWTAERVGCYPAEDSALVRAFPALRGAMLEGLHSHAGAAPGSVRTLEPLYSLPQLQAAAERDASLWCGGTEPGAPEKTPLQSQTLTAGELVSLMQGKRGVVIVQLWNGFDPSKGQPLYDPWVVHLLEAALATPGVRSAPSLAPGGLGLSAVLWADREPWSAWGPHLASFGCQANTVAGSPYYKVLIGKILGYKDDNIYGYVRSVGGGLTPAVVAQVDTDLKRLSKAKPKLPWNREGSRGKKPAPASPEPPPAGANRTGGGGGSGGGGRK